MDITSKDISDNKPDKGPNCEAKILSELPGPGQQLWHKLGLLCDIS